MASSVSHILLNLEVSDDFEIRKQNLEALQHNIYETPLDLKEALSSFTPVADEYQQNVIEATGDTIRIVAAGWIGTRLL